jgi:hypothetical protein
VTFFFNVLIGLIGRRTDPLQHFYLQRTVRKKETRIYTRASGEIRTHNPNVRAFFILPYETFSLC